MKKNKKMIVPKFKIPEGSHAVIPFYFELHELLQIIEECESRKLYSLKIALKKIYNDIDTKRNSYQWVEPKE